MGTRVEQYITYQHNVQRYFREHSEKYAGVIIPISVAVTFPTGTYGFIRALCSKYNHNYSIDPRTALFQHNWDRSNVRSPHQRMADILGPPFDSVGLKRALEPDDFSSLELIGKVCKNCIDFQKNFRSREEDMRKLRKYKKLLGISQLDDLCEPQFLVPPYFLFDQRTDPWYEISMRFIRRALEESKDLPVQPVLHTRRWHAIDEWNHILGEMGDSGIEACWIYVNDFREHDASLDDLKGYRATVEASVAVDVKPYSLFGGYFAVLMGYYGLQGFGNGIGYGEWRDSGYHRGGTAMIRVYVPRVHRYLDAPAAQHIIDIDPDYFASTDLLAEYTSGRKRLADDLTLIEALDHFMECRYNETQFVADRPVEEAITELETTCKHLEAIGPLEHEKYGTSLRRWVDCLRT